MGEWWEWEWEWEWEWWEWEWEWWEWEWWEWEWGVGVGVRCTKRIFYGFLLRSVRFYSYSQIFEKSKTHTVLGFRFAAQPVSQKRNKRILKVVIHRLSVYVTKHSL